jgi:hypothetical protein
MFIGGEMTPLHLSGVPGPWTGESHQKSHWFRFVIEGIHSALCQLRGREVLVLPLSSVKGRFASLTFNP